MGCCQNEISVDHGSTTKTCKITIICQEFKSNNPIPSIFDRKSIYYSSISRFDNFRVFKHGAVREVWKIIISEWNLLITYRRAIHQKVVENINHRHLHIFALHIQVRYSHIAPNKFYVLTKCTSRDIQSILTKLLWHFESNLYFYIYLCKCLYWFKKNFDCPFKNWAQTGAQSHERVSVW